VRNSKYTGAERAPGPPTVNCRKDELPVRAAASQFATPSGPVVLVYARDVYRAPRVTRLVWSTASDRGMWDCVVPEPVLQAQRPTAIAAAKCLTIAISADEPVGLKSKVPICTTRMLRLRPRARRQRGLGVRIHICRSALAARRRAIGQSVRVLASVRSVWLIVLLAAVGCSAHSAPRSVNVSVSLVRGDQFVRGRVSASLPDGTVVASQHQSGKPGDGVNLTVRSGKTYTFRGIADDGSSCAPSTSSAPEKPPGLRTCVDRHRSMLVSVVPGTVGALLISADPCPRGEWLFGYRSVVVVVVVEKMTSNPGARVKPHALPTRSLARLNEVYPSNTALLVSVA
jgi:hypothetical protein